VKNLKESLYFFAAASMIPGLAFAQQGPVNSIVDGICKFIGPFLGASKFLSIVFLISLAVIAFLWWISENKEGVVVWLLRTGVVIGILINIFTIPNLIGLPSPCAGGMGGSGISIGL
jgi:hypothetical protein